MKKVILSLAIVAIAFTANAQKGGDGGLKFGAGVGGGLPIGGFGSLYSVVATGDLQVTYPISDGFSLTGSAGYSYSIGKSPWPSSGLIPVLVGGKYSFSENLYGHVQLGMSFGNGGSAFTYSPSIGYNLSENMDLALRYLATSTVGGAGGNIGLRLGFSF